MTVLEGIWKREEWKKKLIIYFPSIFSYGEEKLPPATFHTINLSALMKLIFKHLWEMRASECGKNKFLFFSQSFSHSLTLARWAHQNVIRIIVKIPLPSTHSLTHSQQCLFACHGLISNGGDTFMAKKSSIRSRRRGKVESTDSWDCNKLLCCSPKHNWPINFSKIGAQSNVWMLVYELLHNWIMWSKTKRESSSACVLMRTSKQQSGNVIIKSTSSIFG